jgi:hypothetical protein
MEDQTPPTNTPATDEAAVRASWGIGLELALAIAMVASIAVTAAYHFLARPEKEIRIARIDLAAVMREQQRTLDELAERMQDDPQRASQIAAERGKSFSLALQRLADECKCVLLVSDAVVHGAEDVTPRLREILNAQQ